MFYYTFNRGLFSWAIKKVEYIFHISNFPLCCHSSALVTSNLKTRSCVLFSCGGRARTRHSKYLPVYPQSLFCICLIHRDSLVFGCGGRGVWFDFLLSVCAQFDFKPAGRLAVRLGSVRRTHAGSLSFAKANEQTGAFKLSLLEQTAFNFQLVWRSYLPLLTQV